MEPETRPPAWKTLTAFAVIYLVWGSTFLAIRVGVSEAPPFLLAAMRFTAAGAFLYGWMRLNGERAQKKVAHWQAVALAACEQCGRTRVPRSQEVVALKR